MIVGIDIRPLLTPVRTGVAEYAYGLLDALFQFDRQNHFFLFYNDIRRLCVFLPQWEYPNVHFVRVRVSSKALNAGMAIVGWPKVDRLLGKKLDYFFSPNPNFIALSPGVKHILTIHDLSFELFPETYSWKRRVWHAVVNPRRQCERAHCILTPSENTKRDVVRIYGVKERKVHVIAPGISFSSDLNNELRTKNIELEIQQKYRLPEKFILFLGTIEPRKNIFGFIDAYKLYSMQYTYPAELIIAGPLGWKWKGILRAIQKTRGVRYIGPVEEEEKPALYALSRVLVYPSLYEGFGFPVLEAMQAGTPVITSNRSSLPEIAGGSAYLVNPHDAADMARAIDILLSDQEVRKQLMQSGKACAERYTWQRAAEAWLNALR